MYGPPPSGSTVVNNHNTSTTTTITISTYLMGAGMGIYVVTSHNTNPITAM